MIVIGLDGVDGTGKSTVLEFLKTLFTEQGYIVHNFQEPGTTAVGWKVRELVKSQIHLNWWEQVSLFNAGMEATFKDIRTLAKQPNSDKLVVLLDRTFYSTLVYQNPYKLFSKEQREQPEFAYYDQLYNAIISRQLFNLRSVNADIYILDVESKVAFDRMAKRSAITKEEADRWEAQGLNAHNKRRDAYKDLAELYGLPIITNEDSLKTAHQIFSHY